MPCFGFSPEHEGADKLREQVKVHHYGGENDFVIELLTKDAAEQLVLARLPERPTTLGSAIAATRKHLRDDAPDARWDDLVVIPNMCLAAKSRFSELEGRRVRGNGKTLTQAMQLVDFRMDEQGVRLRSEAAVSFGCSAGPARVEPRRIIVKPPFRHHDETPRRATALLRHLGGQRRTPAQAGWLIPSRVQPDSEVESYLVVPFDR